jgi:hypothetical protein
VIHFAQHVNNSVDEKLSSWDFLGTAPIRPWTEPTFPGRSAAGCTPIQQTDNASDLRHGRLYTASTDAMVTTSSHLSITDHERPTRHHAVDNAEPEQGVRPPWKDVVRALGQRMVTP